MLPRQKALWEIWVVNSKMILSTYTYQTFERILDSVENSHLVGELFPLQDYLNCRRRVSQLSRAVLFSNNWCRPFFKAIRNKIADLKSSKRAMAPLFVSCENRLKLVDAIDAFETKFYNFCEGKTSRKKKLSSSQFSQVNQTVWNSKQKATLWSQETVALRCDEEMHQLLQTIDAIFRQRIQKHPNKSFDDELKKIIKTAHIEILKDICTHEVIKFSDFYKVILQNEEERARKIFYRIQALNDSNIPPIEKDFLANPFRHKEGISFEWSLSFFERVLQHFESAVDERRTKEEIFEAYRLCMGRIDLFEHKENGQIGDLYSRLRERRAQMIKRYPEIQEFCLAFPDYSSEFDTVKPEDVIEVDLQLSNPTRRDAEIFNNMGRDDFISLLLQLSEPKQKESASLGNQGEKQKKGSKAKGRTFSDGPMQTRSHLDFTNPKISPQARRVREQSDPKRRCSMSSGTFGFAPIPESSHYTRTVTASSEPYGVKPEKGEELQFTTDIQSNLTRSTSDNFQSITDRDGNGNLYDGDMGLPKSTTIHSFANLPPERKSPIISQSIFSGSMKKSKTCLTLSQMNGESSQSQPKGKGKPGHTRLAASQSVSGDMANAFSTDQMVHTEREAPFTVWEASKNPSPQTSSDSSDGESRSVSPLLEKLQYEVNGAKAEEPVRATSCLKNFSKSNENSFWDDSICKLAASFLVLKQPLDGALSDYSDPIKRITKLDDALRKLLPENFGKSHFYSQVKFQSAIRFNHDELKETLDDGLIVPPLKLGQFADTGNNCFYLEEDEYGVDECLRASLKYLLIHTEGLNTAIKRQKLTEKNLTYSGYLVLCGNSYFALRRRRGKHLIKQLVFTAKGTIEPKKDDADLFEALKHAYYYDETVGDLLDEVCQVEVFNPNKPNGEYEILTYDIYEQLMDQEDSFDENQDERQKVKIQVSDPIEEIVKEMMGVFKEEIDKKEKIYFLPTIYCEQ